MAVKVSISDVDNSIKCSGGQFSYDAHVIPTVDEYNKLIRQINILKLLVLELIPRERQHGLVDKLLKTNTEILE